MLLNILVPGCWLIHYAKGGIVRSPFLNRHPSLASIFLFSCRPRKRLSDVACNILWSSIWSYFNVADLKDLFLEEKLGYLEYAKEFTVSMLLVSRCCCFLFFLFKYALNIEDDAFVRFPSLLDFYLFIYFNIMLITSWPKWIWFQKGSFIEGRWEP